MPSSFKAKTWSWRKHPPILLYLGAALSALRPAYPGYSFEQNLDLFLAEVGERVGTKPCQIQQASDAMSIYCYQYCGAKAGGGRSRNAQVFN